jgi:cytochrome b561
MWIRIGSLGILTAAAAAFAIITAHDVIALAALVAGIAAGAALGHVGLRYTKFEVQSEGRFYTPHAYIGVAVTALFFGRLLYRFLTVYDGALPNHGVAGSYEGNPFTLALFGALVGYYVFYYLGVLQRTRIASAVPVSK